MQNRVRMLRKIQMVQFAVIDLNLYLNTHPRDRRALDEHNRLVAELDKLEEEYVQKYGILTAFSSSPAPWQWIDDPWPWEINYSR